jgi:hypothetical protein
VSAPRHPAGAGSPRLEPFGLVLRRDGSWTHEGVPVTHPRLRAAFDRSVRFLPEEGVYVVQLGRFRGRIEVEEAGFFVREVDLARGRVRLSDGSVDALDVASLRPSRFDGAWLCTVKRALRPGGLPARFTHASQAELLGAVEEDPGGPRVRIAGEAHPLPGALAASC